MVIGAGWAGARAFTSTAGPGISLMSEFIGLAYYTEIPGVFFDIQRTGPSTGMPTRTQQGDLLSIAYLSHGDTKHIALFPANPDECFYHVGRRRSISPSAFRRRCSSSRDLDIGMNDWMCRASRGTTAIGPIAARCSAPRSSSGSRRSRAISTSTATASPRARCPACIRKGAYFTRGSGHDKHATYTEDSAEYQEVVDRLREEARDGGGSGAGAGDSSERAGATSRSASSRSAAVTRRCSRRCDALRADGIVGRLHAHPRVPVRRGGARVPRGARRRCFVVEQNRDAQLRSLLAIETGIARDRMTSVLDYGGTAAHRRSRRRARE